MVVDTKLPLSIVTYRNISNRSLESDEGSTIPTAPRKRTRRVHFAESPVSKETVKVALIPTKEELDTLQLYYTRYEIRKMWSKAKKNADHISNMHLTVVSSIEQLFESAAPSESPKQSHRAISDLYDTSSRGLERLISDHLTEQRKSAVKRVLEVQASTKDRTQRANLMRMRSMLVSRKARTFAERLGAADAVEAQK